MTDYTNLLKQTPFSQPNPRRTPRPWEAALVHQVIHESVKDLADNGINPRPGWDVESSAGDLKDLLRWVISDAGFSSRRIVHHLFNVESIAYCNHVQLVTLLRWLDPGYMEAHWEINPYTFVEIQRVLGE